MAGWYRKRWFLNSVKFLLIVIVLSVAWYFVRIELRPGVPEPTGEMRARAEKVKILRDNFGVPHIFGKTDADTAFGLAYAHAEDDYPIIQGSLAAARGNLAILMPGKLGGLNDYMVKFLGIDEKAGKQYDELLSPAFKKILEAYADGLNYYAALHPDDVDSRILSYTGKDISAGFIHKLSLFTGVARTLKDLMGRPAGDLAVGETIQGVVAQNDFLPFWFKGEQMGSNTHAVGPSLSADGITRLNINSHQPYEGPVAWYEAHLVSEEGWNAIGGLFPGSPSILHGHNQYLGWAHTVNKPDAIDVYKLSMHPDGSLKYRFDGEWKELSVIKAKIRIDLGLFTLPIPRTFYRSIHGPVLERDGGYYALRYVGKDRAALSTEQWYRMNRAKNMEEWKAAMAMQGIPMMNVMYADRENILYVYNHLLPIRSEKFDWLQILPGDTSDALWTAYLPFDRLPMAENPPSGFLMNTNSTPFQATVGEGNPRPDDFSATLGIETIMNNRALRSMELFGTDDSITREEFLTYKFDQAYSQNSRLFTDVLGPLIEKYEPAGEDEKAALGILRGWDGVCGADSAPALVNLLYHSVWDAQKTKTADELYPDVARAFQEAVAFLTKNFKRVDVPLGEVQRLRRGKTDIPLGGGIDALNSVHTKLKEERLVAVAGDSYILVVEFTDSGARFWSRHQYGNVNRKDSVHYDDQARAFTRRTLKKSLLTLDEIRQNLETEYHPGME
ncbi:MAG: penicillin acylase family protein [Desulfobacter sp.]|nr:penicillin acylase family protein [Desulfobacter sp.]